MRSVVALPVLAVVAGCATPVSTISRPAEYYGTASADARSDSLFSDEETVLSDEAIRRILAHEYEVPASSRVALLPFGREAWSEWSEELAVATEHMRKEVIERLVASPRVFDASYLPSILIPHKKSVPYLREAAARYQADLLLVYRTHCRTFERYRLFARDRSRAYCGVEAVLLDTRSGLVPFTSVVLESFEAVESDSDISFEETMLKAELEATTDALAGIASEVVNFLGD